MNIDFEKRFIDLLGYKILENKIDNNWLIIDDKDNEVGFIKYDVIYKDIYGYITKIDSDSVKYNNTRIDNKLYNMDNSYNFSLQDNSSVEMTLDDISRLNIWSELGLISFCVNKNALFFSFKSDGEKYHYEEKVEIKNELNNRHFSYIVVYAPIEKEIIYNSINTKVMAICFKQSENEDELEIEMRSFEGHIITEEEKNLVNGNLIDAIKDQELAINAFNYLRKLINDILPFKIDIIDYMFENIKVDSDELLIIKDNNLKRSLKK